jgi:hypothetical protein
MATLLKLIRAMIDFSRMSVLALIERANIIHAGMYQNPDYPDPPVAMSVLRTTIDDLTAANTAAADGSSKAISHRNTLAATLCRMLRQLAHYVEGNCRNDMTTFLSSGFEVVHTTRTKTRPLSEAIRKIQPGPGSGQFLVWLVAVSIALSYEIRWAQVSDSAPGSWSYQPIGRVKTPTLVTNLTPGATYVLQARAVTASGATEWSQSVTRICT